MHDEEPRRPWKLHPTFSFPMRIGDKVTDALDRHDWRSLNHLRVVWFDWRVAQWRRDNEGWMLRHGWRSHPHYGGRLVIRASPSSVLIRPVYVGEPMPKLKVVPKVKEEVEETVEPKKAKAKAKAKKEAKTGKYTGVTTGLGVAAFQNQLMERNFKAKLTDPQLAAAMRREFPEAIDYNEDHVVGIRSSWNKGNHENDKPARPLPQFDDTGKAMPFWGEKSAAEKAARAELKEAKEIKKSRKSKSA